MRYAIISNPRDQISAGLAGAGSVAIVSFNLGRCLAEAGHEVILVAARGKRQPATETLGPGLKVLRVRSVLGKLHKYRERAASVFESLPPHFLSRAYFIEYYLGAALALREHQPDIIHIQNYAQMSWIFRLIHPRAHIVAHLHDACLAQVSPRVGKRVLGGADLVVTCSDYVTQSVGEAQAEHDFFIRTVNNGVDVSNFRPQETSAADRDSSLRLAYIGRLSPEKGPHVLIDAFNQIVERVPDARLELIGGPALFSYAVVKIFKRDPHWSSLKRFYGTTFGQRLMRSATEPGAAYADSLKSRQSPQAARNTRFLGEQPHPAIASIIADTDVLVVPSVCDEPFGIPAVEAMAAGVPVVASAAGGLRGIVQNGQNGLLVPRSDAAALADAVVSMTDPQRRASMARAARETVQKRFTWENVASNLLRALTESELITANAAANPTSATGRPH